MSVLGVLSTVCLIIITLLFALFVQFVIAVERGHRYLNKHPGESVRVNLGWAAFQMTRKSEAQLAHDKEQGHKGARITVNGRRIR